MKFKIDQNLPAECASTLLAAGHDAITVYQQQLGGAPDEQVVAVCHAEGRILITSDLDLSDITHYPPADSPGYVVYRSRRQGKAAMIDLTGQLIELLARHEISGRLWILEHGRLRIRS